MIVEASWDARCRFGVSKPASVLPPLSAQDVLTGQGVFNERYESN